MPEQGVVAPYSVAMVLCDAVYIEPETQKKTLVGLFTALLAKEFPVAHPKITVYFSCADGFGKVPLKLRLVDSEDIRPPIFEVVTEIQIEDRLAVSEAIFFLQGLVFPEPGEYRMQVYACDELLIERRLLVVKLEQKP